MATFLQQVERDFYVRKAGGATPQTPLNHLKRIYWSAQIGGAEPKMPLQQLEKRWLLKVLADATVTPTDSNSLETLWKQAVSTLSITPSKYLNDNLILYYRNAA